MPRTLTAALLSTLLLTACSSSVPRLHRPDRVDVFCGDRVTVATAIESIVSSTGDVTEHFPVPTQSQIQKIIADGGGVIAHWNDQPLYLPVVAKSLGAAGDYVTLGDAAISNRPSGVDSRRIYLTLRTSAGPQTFAMRAYDVQDVCNEGKLKS